MSATVMSIFNGQAIRLVPLEAEHKAGLAALLNDPRIWEFTWRKINSLPEAEQLVDTALANRAKGTELPFVMLEQATGRIAGTSRIMHLDRAHRSAEIGCTWISPEYWRTAVNTEAKAMLLRHCFEELGLVRVSFTIVEHNIRSQRAIERIGAVREGVLRKHRVTSDGTSVNNVVYSILDEEWPAVKANLEYLLKEKYSQQ
ncbi:GNAT family N-acetyltransferase [Paenibacillus tengchongensis]|uniref:GNAT family N-acetyltransferase n=1 Tax=Paenibacillus tengchongensis TaxID=2608684 RepID=UPI001FEB0833|nr:GNAT family N-acetyltransferase [Paenibacillus tengchongensis]